MNGVRNISYSCHDGVGAVPIDDIGADERKAMSNVEISEYYVAEWSPSQKVFSVDRLDIILKRNQNIFAHESQGGGFLPLAVFKTRDDARRFCNSLEPARDKMVETGK